MTHLRPSPDGFHIAVGYEDGSVRIFSLLNGESNVSFNGHKSAITVMHYDTLGARLVTGSKVRSKFMHMYSDLWRLEAAGMLKRCSCISCRTRM